MAGQPMRHGWRLAFQTRMLPAPVVMAEQDRQSRTVVPPAFREALGQPAHSFAERANRAVQPFNVASANLRLLRDADYPSALGPYYPQGRILPTLILIGLAVYLDQHPVMNAVAKVLPNRHWIRRP